MTIINGKGITEQTNKWDQDMIWRLSVILEGNEYTSAAKDAMYKIAQQYAAQDMLHQVVQQKYWLTLVRMCKENQKAIWSQVESNSDGYEKDDTVDFNTFKFEYFAPQCNLLCIDIDLD